jgi:hypothetical protein
MGVKHNVWNKCLTSPTAHLNDPIELQSDCAFGLQFYAVVSTALKLQLNCNLRLD